MASVADFESCVTANRMRWINHCADWMPRQDAEDVVSEAVLKAWRALPQFKGDCELSTWIGKIIRNLIVDRKRSGAGRFTHIPLWDDDQKAPKWLPETVTHWVIFAEICALIGSPCITTKERDAVLGEKADYGSRPSLSIRQRRLHGISKIRRLMAGEVLHGRGRRPGVQRIA